MIKYLYSLILVFLIGGLNAQNCEIGNLQVQIQPCDPQGFYTIILDFDHANTSIQGFTLNGNGQNYGSYFYEDLPVTVTGPFLGNGVNVYELVAKDAVNVACYNFTTFGPVNCNLNDCHIYDLVVDTLDCTSDSTYSVLVDFQYDNVGGAGFKLFYNGDLWDTYDYSDLPLIINDLPVVGGNTFSIIKVQDIVNPDCQLAKDFKGLKCGLEDCEISNVTADVSPCDSTGHFYVTINFNHSNTGNDGFRIKGNGTNYGTFNYADLPVTLGPFESSNVKDWEFAVIDVQNEDCRNFVEVGVVDCDDDCEIFEWDAIPLECTSDSTYALKIDFLYNDYPDSLFWVYGNGQYLGSYHLNSLPVTILNFPQGGSNIDTITICAPDTVANCCHSRTFEGITCPNVDCHILELQVTNMDCTSDSTYSGVINFVHQNSSGAGFDLWINNTFMGTFSYSSLPLTLTNMPSNGSSGDLIKVCDHEFQDCCKAKEYNGPSCGTGDCHLYDLEVTTFDCTSDDTYKVIINFQHDNTQSNSFDLFANGQFFGFYQYSQLPLTILNFPKSGGNYDWIKVSDNDNAGCFTVKEFPTVDCGNSNPCTITELQVIVGDCTSDDTYEITVNFNHANTSGSFDLYTEGGSLFGTYQYSQLPLTISNYPKLGTGPNDFVKVCDDEFPDCCKVKEFPSPDCGNNNPCSITELQVTVGDCTSDNTYTITINFNHTNTSSSFDLYTEGGVLFGTYQYAQLPLTITNYPKIGTGPNDVVKVCDHEVDDCCKVKEFPSPDCGNSNSCSITEIQVTVGDCNNDNTYQITINFNHSNTTNSFDLFTEGGVLFGTYLYSQLPLTIPNYPKIGTGPNDLVKVCDHELNDCCKAKEFPSPNCGGDPCHLYDIVVEPIECTSSTTYKIAINFQHQNTVSNSFDLFAQGVYFGTYLYSQLPLTINNFPSNGSASDHIKVQDHELESCSATKEFAGLSCGNPICQIVEIDVDLGDCLTDSTYQLVLNFIVQNPGSDRFDLYANGVYFGTYFYTQLPLTIPNFPNSGNQNDWLKVCDHELDDCCKTKEFTSPSCFSGGPVIYDIHVQVNNCITNTFQAQIEFEHNNTGNQGFKIQGNGNTYGTFNYSELPVKINDLLADAVTEYEFVITDVEFPTATDYYFLGRVDCTTETIDPLSHQVSFNYHFDGENLIIKSNEDDILTGFKMFDIMGKLLYSSNSTSSQYSVNTDRWVPGMYVLFVQAKQGYKSVLVAKSK